MTSLTSKRFAFNVRSLILPLMVFFFGRVALGVKDTRLLFSFKFYTKRFTGDEMRAGAKYKFPVQYYLKNPAACYQMESPVIDPPGPDFSLT